jgi:hypothetical protein
MTGTPPAQPDRCVVQSHLFPWGQAGTAHRWVSVFVEHDRDHARDLRE